MFYVAFLIGFAITPAMRKLVEYFVRSRDKKQAKKKHKEKHKRNLGSQDAESESGADDSKAALRDARVTASSDEAVPSGSVEDDSSEPLWSKICNVLQGFTDSAAVEDTPAEGSTPGEENISELEGEDASAKPLWSKISNVLQVFSDNTEEKDSHVEEKIRDSSYVNNASQPGSSSVTEEPSAEPLWSKICNVLQGLGDSAVQEDDHTSEEALINAVADNIPYPEEACVDANVEDTSTGPMWSQICSVFQSYTDKEVVEDVSVSETHIPGSRDELFEGTDPGGASLHASVEDAPSAPLWSKICNVFNAAPEDTSVSTIDEKGPALEQTLVTTAMDNILEQEEFESPQPLWSKICNVLPGFSDTAVQESTSVSEDPAPGLEDQRPEQDIVCIPSIVDEAPTEPLWSRLCNVLGGSGNDTNIPSASNGTPEAEVAYVSSTLDGAPSGSQEDTPTEPLWSKICSVLPGFSDTTAPESSESEGYDRGPGVAISQMSETVIPTVVEDACTEPLWSKLCNVFEVRSDNEEEKVINVPLSVGRAEPEAALQPDSSGSEIDTSTGPLWYKICNVLQGHSDNGTTENSHDAVSEEAAPQREQVCGPASVEDGPVQPFWSGLYSVFQGGSDSVEQDVPLYVDNAPILEGSCVEPENADVYAAVEDTSGDEEALDAAGIEESPSKSLWSKMWNIMWGNSDSEDQEEAVDDTPQEVWFDATVKAGSTTKTYWFDTDEEYVPEKDEAWFDASQDTRLVPEGPCTYTTVDNVSTASIWSRLYNSFHYILQFILFGNEEESEAETDYSDPANNYSQPDGFSVSSTAAYIPEPGEKSEKVRKKKRKKRRERRKK